MTEDPKYQELQEIAWRRPLSVAEKAELDRLLEATPGGRADWEAGIALAAAFRRLSDVEVSSNFEARVMEQVRRESVQRDRGQTGLGWFAVSPWRWVARAGVVAALLMVGFGVHHHAQSARRSELAASLLTLSEAASWPSPEALADFDAIQAMSRAPAADEELLSLLQ